MKLSSILSEARKHPHLNQKISINSVVRKSYDKAEQLSIGIKNSFVSFTKIEKLGVNPTSKYNTPIGIYCYPSVYVIRKTSTINNDDLPMARLPFAGSSPYGNIFSSSGNIIRIDNMSDSQSENILAQLLKVVETKYSDIEHIIDTYNVVLEDSFNHAKFDQLVGGRLWYIIMTMAECIGRARGVKAAIMWNKLFRDLGIDGVVDMGSGIIHTAEETQAVFFSLENIKNVIRIANKYSKSYMDTQILNGLRRTKMIASLKTMSREEQIEFTVSDSFLINYVEKSVREECIRKRAYLLYEVKNTTKDDVLAALDGSKLQLILSIYNNIDRKPEKLQSNNPKDFQTELKSYNKIQTIRRVLRTIPERDIMHLIDKWLSEERNQGMMCKALLNYFPKYDRMFNLLWKKFPKSIFSISNSIQRHFDELIVTKIRELGKDDPDSELYAFFKRQMDGII